MQCLLLYCLYQNSPVRLFFNMRALSSDAEAEMGWTFPLETRAAPLHPAGNRTHIGGRVR